MASPADRRPPRSLYLTSLLFFASGVIRLLDRGAGTALQVVGAVLVLVGVAICVVVHRLRSRPSPPS
ncbi:MAG: hypothetical protein ABI890_07260 [Lapillicoccus sp.]